MAKSALGPVFAAILGALLVAACGHTRPVIADDIQSIFRQNATLHSVCDRSDIDGFKYYFFHEVVVRRAFVASSVRVLRPREKPRNVKRVRYVPPVFGMYQGVETIKDASNDTSMLKVEVVPLPNCGFQIVWVRAEYELEGAAAMPTQLTRTYGPAGRLTFRRTSQCWELTEDSVEFSA